MRIAATANLTKTQKFSAAGLAAAAGATALAVGAAPASANTGDSSQSLARPASVESVNKSVKAGAPIGDHATGKKPSSGLIKTVSDTQEGSTKPVELAGLGKKDQVKALDAQHTLAKQEQKAKESREGKKASRSSDRPKYANNLDGWIREARSIMKKEGIPGSYEGIHRNIIRESGGNPNISNDWDINAKNGTPSKGLLQVIQPTFDAYHVKGTKDKLTDPVANIVAACNYAADRYGSMDNVDSAY